MSSESSSPTPKRSRGTLNTQNDPILVVSSYTQFDNLAHGPRGTESRRSLSVLRMNGHNGSVEMLSTANGVMNPAFMRYHPTENVIYACTESVTENGQIVAWRLNPSTGRLTEIGSADAGGTSTCYITIDKAARHLLIVNYWDATIGVLPIQPDGTFASKTLTFTYDPKESPGKMLVSADKHVNHSINDASAQSERQLDPHSHAIVLEPYFGAVAYVPDLGRDVVRELYYDQEAGTLKPLTVQPSGPKADGPHGPRYIEFHKSLPVAYVVNELSSQVAVFAVDEQALESIAKHGPSANDSATLTYVQTVSTIPDAWPRADNTCGRICCDRSGRFVLVSNRGHDSIAVFRIVRSAASGVMPGLLKAVGIFHTRGMTPRHFQFDPSGQWLIAANQDDDRVGVFHFNLQCGTLLWTGNYHRIHSPNFVLSCDVHVQEEVTGVVEDIEQVRKRLKLN